MISAPQTYPGGAAGLPSPPLESGLDGNLLLRHRVGTGKTATRDTCLTPPGGGGGRGVKVNTTCSNTNTSSWEWQVPPRVKMGRAPHLCGTFPLNPQAQPLQRQYQTHPNCGTFCKTPDQCSSKMSGSGEFPLRLSGLRTRPISMKMQVRSLTSLSGLKDPVLLQAAV